MEIKEKVLELVTNKDFTKKLPNELFSLLGLDDTFFKEYIKTINELEDECVIFISKNGYLHNASKLSIYRGTIKVVRRYSAICELDNGDRITIENENLDNAYTGDIVKVHVSKNQTGEIIDIIKRNMWQVIATYSNHNFTVESRNFPYEIKVNRDPNIHLVNGHIVLLKIKKYDGFILNAEVVKILGHKNDPGVDILTSIINAGVKYEFDDELLNNTNKVINEKELTLNDELKKRKDFTNKLIVTIDGLEAKDLDDAISLEYSDNGNYLLGVHIADVSHYVEKDSMLDKEAFTRGTSIYLADRVIPMLPQSISNGVCSLNPNEIKLTMSCMMEIDETGKVIDYEITPSFIKSSYRLDYDDVNRLFKKEETIKEYPVELKKMLYNANILSHILSKKMVNRGYLSLNVPEAKINIDRETGKVINITNRVQDEAEKLIENFMIVANETVASAIYYMQLPFIYRVHDEPTKEKLDTLISNLKDMKINLNFRGNYVSSKLIQNILDEVKGKDNEQVVNDFVLRSMSKAIYQVDNIGHFGLGSECYTHFTSPIRRYPDLIVHRFLKKYLVNNDFSDEMDFLVQASDNSTITERKAIDLEREVEDIKKAEYMENFVGQIFEGTITGMLDFGMFIRLDNTCEGLLRYENMNTGYYETFDSIKKRYNIGSRVTVKVNSTNITNGEINFALVAKKSYNRSGKKYENYKHK